MRNIICNRWVAFALCLFFSLGAYAQEEQDEFSLLEKSFEELLDVEITTAGKTAEKISDIPATVEIVTRRDIERYGYRNVAEILSHVPGLFTFNEYYFNTLSMRGFWSDNGNKNVVSLSMVSQSIQGT